MKKITIAAVLCAASAAVAAQNTKDAALGQYIHRITEDAINTCFDLGLLEIKGQHQREPPMRSVQWA